MEDKVRIVNLCYFIWIWILTSHINDSRPEKTFFVVQINAFLLTKIKFLKIWRYFAATVFSCIAPIRQDLCEIKLCFRFFMKKCHIFTVQSPDSAEHNNVKCLFFYIDCSDKNLTICSCFLTMGLNNSELLRYNIFL